MDATDKKVKTIVGMAMLLWLVLAYILGANNSFAGAPGALPFPILAGLLAPIVVFLIAFRRISLFHDFVMSIDLPTMAGIQAWRLGGLGFLALYAYGILPGLFAWPAGLGDMAIGLTAPLVILALRRRPAFAVGRLFLAWNLLGMLDLIVAVGLGATSAVLGIGISAEITTFPMGVLPLVLVPTFLVPLFLMLHLAALLQAGQMAVTGRVCGWAESTIRCEPIEALHKA